VSGRLAVALLTLVAGMFGGGYSLVDPGWMRRIRARRRARARGGWIR